MGKKKRSGPSPRETYNNSPFKHLKGFAISEPEEDLTPPQAPPVEPSIDTERTFAEEMSFLGVDPLRKDADPPITAPQAGLDRGEDISPDTSDEELFLGSLGEFDACFTDHIPEQEKIAAPRRLKQLKLGRLTPEARLDLHGLQRHQVADKIAFFLQNATYLQMQTLLIITGRGLHSPTGEPVLRDEAENTLETYRKSLIAEWGRAPRQYGGDGALVVFLKKSSSET